MAMPNALSRAERQRLAAKASKLEPVLPIEILLTFDDEGLRVMADDLSPEEWAERERNSDWIEEMDEERKETDRKAGIVRPKSPLLSALLPYLAKDTRTATERALGIPATEVKPNLPLP